MAQHVPCLLDLPASVLLIILSLAGPKEGARLASCCHALHAAAAACRLFWTRVLDRGEAEEDVRLQASAVRALKAAELKPALEAGSELRGRMAAVAVRLALQEHETVEAQWTAGREAAERFWEEAEAQRALLEWLETYGRDIGMVEGVLQYVVGSLKLFPQHEGVQEQGCYALRYLCFRYPALRERAGELGAVEAQVHALDRFAASNQGVRDCGILVLRRLTDGLPLNAARLEAAGGAHYLQEQEHA